MMIGYLFINSVKEIKTIAGRNMPEVYFSRKEADFVKRNHKDEFKGWMLKKVSLKIHSKPFYPLRGIPKMFIPENDISM